MAGLKEIKRRIKSVQNTKKITYAMKLVSAAKLRKAQDWLTRAREYTDALQELLQDVVRDRGGNMPQHPLMEKRTPVRRSRLIVIGGRRGLCGAYNSNINRAVDAVYAAKKSAQVESIVLGRKPADHFRRKRYPGLRFFENLSDNANEWPLQEISSECENAFLRGELDEVVLVFTRFRSALSVHVEAERLLPLEFPAPTNLEIGGSTIYEPSREEIFKSLVPLYIRSKLLLSALESKAAEEGSRMTAMDAATENAGELITRLSLMHNKLRQASITSDLLDIIGGSENLEM